MFQGSQFVTPGYYYDTVNLQKLVAAPDVVRKNAALKDNSYEGEEIAGNEKSDRRNNGRTDFPEGSAALMLAGAGAFLHKIAMPKRQYGIRQYLKLRYLA